MKEIVLLIVGSVVGAITTLAAGAGLLEFFVGYEKVCVVGRGYSPLIDGPGKYDIYVSEPELTNEFLSLSLVQPTKTKGGLEFLRFNDEGVKDRVVYVNSIPSGLKARAGDDVRLKLDKNRRISAALYDSASTSKGKVRVTRIGLIENPIRRPNYECAVDAT